ncbi:MAG: Uncharacterised protein [Flavobacterium sp. SCGC AAA160-P02]|nr:MAG: Uncharacterised protein [Flavobacterium sp. SCGC AAA160-P02]
MENQVSSKNIMLKYGVYLAVSSILINLVFYATGTLLTLTWALGLIGILLMVVVLVMGIKKYREINGGLLSWGQAVKIGLGITMVSAIIAVIWSLVFNYIDPTIKEQAMELQRQTWENANMTTEQIEAAEEMTKSLSSPAIESAIQIIASAFFGFIISAIGGAVMKKSEGDEY